MNESKSVNYKETLNLPRTAFPMKANLAQREPEILEFWERVDIYKLILEQTKGRPVFVLHDGPPYANGDIHLGHTLNKVLKDIVVKYKSMRGYFCPFVPGWDCHGQPIEHEVEKRLGVERSKISRMQLRKRCKNYALKYVNRQREQFKRLGVRGDFKNPYLTLDYSYEATNIEIFGRLYDRGLIYKGKKPIYWCYRCETALAEAEIEYEEEKSPSIYVKFPIKGNFAPLGRHKKPKFVLIWTTTPWTLPANVAVAVHPDVYYSAVEVNGEIYLLLDHLLEQVFKEVGIQNYKILKKFKGKELKGLVYVQPLQGWDCPMVLADFVAFDQGTGCVHIAPGHGQEDFEVGLQHHLPAPMPVDGKGFFTKEAGKFRGKHILEANQFIIDDLKRRNLLLYNTTIIHSYPHCWRCKKPVIFRATEQWFISVDKDRLRKEALEEITKVKWIPEWSENRIASMVKERPDWCISRQRSWGVPIPVFYCKNCQKPLVSKETIAAVVDLFKREGADSWFKKSAEEILPSGMVCSSCSGPKFTKETNILDVWFESGISHAAVLKNRSELVWPADLYLEGSDQHRGWFQSSLLTSVGVEDRAPYRAVLTHGFLVDQLGRKMSKSLGNVIDPLEVIKESGADILRLWVASADYTTDIAVSREILERISEAYRRLRNTARYLLGNLHDFDPRKDALRYEDLEEIDKWALLRLHKLLLKVTKAYEEYKFHLVYHAIYNFCVTDMSAFYLDVLKDRLYTSKVDSPKRRSAQTVLFEILVNLAKILSPILAFTSEEIWQNIPEEYRDKISVQLCPWPEVQEEYLDRYLEERWDRLLEVRDEVLKALEIARDEKLVGNSLEAAVTIHAPSDLYGFLDGYKDMLPTIFIVSQVNLSPSTEAPGKAFRSERLRDVSILISKAVGEKCERCWNFSESVGRDAKHKKLCARCVEVVKSFTG
ncbi:MAG: isoleucine--tRNA ligase [Actinomycetota bacterium]|nr:isoleucine--tRNA ligase [Actinomycetota bacterium]